MLKKRILWIFCLFAISWIYSINATCAVKIGSSVFNSSFNTDVGEKIWSKLPSSHWVNEGIKGNTCLLVDGTGMVHTSIDLKPYRGMMLSFSCLAKAVGVTIPPASYLGVKYMFHYKSPSSEVWRNEDNVSGTFNWKELSFKVPIPKDATVGDLSLGLQGSTGKVWFDKIRVIVADISNANLALNKRVNAITKLRGVMSPMKYKNSDLNNLGQNWNANLIRWQINIPQSALLDLSKYDVEINKKLAELDSVLISCKRYNIKVVVDLHTVPGGRTINGKFLMCNNPKYRDYFIKLWQRITKRYKGNTVILGFDLMNEPPEDYEINDLNNGKTVDYWQIEISTIQVIREIDRERNIIYEVGNYDSPNEYNFFHPLNFQNIIYELHMYAPWTYTAQGVDNDKSGIIYPGMIDGIYYDKKTLRSILQPVRNFQLAYNAPIYVGEFSAVRWAPSAAKYIDDCISIFEEYGWNWTYHAYREWNGWDVEYENGTSKHDKAKVSLTDTDRKKVLLKWFAKNNK